MPNVIRREATLSTQVADLKRQVAALLKLLAPPDTDRSISGFCKRKGISRSHFYKLKEQNKAPRIAHAGYRRFITPEAERDWDIEREAEGAEAALQKSENSKAAPV
jgi:hypothetical protein